MKRVWHAIATRTDHFNYLLQGAKKKENTRKTWRYV